MKKVLFLFFVMSFCSIMFAQAGSGAWRASAGDDGYTLDANEGVRTYSIEVEFEKPFEVKPEIILSVSLLDIPVDSPILYDVKAKAISRDGFIIQIKTWNNARIINVGGSWLAIGMK